MSSLPKGVNEDDRGESCVLLIEQKIQETRLVICGAMLPRVYPAGVFL